MTENLASTPIDAVQAQDLGRLFEEFSQATARLQAAHDALLDEVAGLKRRLAATHRRLERKKRLEALGRVAAGVAHEFRNPLGGIRLTVDALLADAPAERARQRLDHVERAVAQLDRIVEDLLSFARSPRLDKTHTRIADLVGDAVETTLSRLDSGSRPILREGPPDLAVAVDRHAMTQVLANLLLNAHQVMGTAAGRVGIFWGPLDGDSIWIEVTDDGPGIAAGEEEQVFELFHSRRQGGTGLGLAIVRERVEAHDGEVAVVTDPWGPAVPWPGACFRILLPARDARKEE